MTDDPRNSVAEAGQRQEEPPTDDDVLDFLVAYYHFPDRATMESFTDWQTDIRDEVKLIQSWATLRTSGTPTPAQRKP